MNRVFQALILFLLFVPLFAQKPQVPPEEKCYNAYREGEYDRAADCLNSLLYSGELKDTARLLKAYEILGVSLTMMEKKEPAKAAFKKMIRLDPKIELNPNVYLPDIISMFQIARFEYNTQLKVVLVDTVPAYPKVLNFMPGAAPQFLNKQMKKGVAMLALQTLSLGLSVYAYQKETSYYSSVYGFREEDLSTAGRYDRIHRITLFTLVGVYLYSLVDGFINKPIVFKM
jgi:tetratricopeptide (TPR) repeat protein